MQVTPITTHVVDALARLVSQYQGDPMMVALVTAIVTPIQEMETAAFSLDAGRQLQNAQGAQLDALGTLVGVPRQGLDDATYLAYLLGSIAEDSSDGTAPALLRIAAQLFGAADVWLSDVNAPTQQMGAQGRAWVALGLGSPTLGGQSPQFSVALRALTASLSAAVALLYLVSFPAGSGQAFGFAGPQPDLGGFGDATNAQTGGQMATLLYNNGML